MIETNYLDPSENGRVGVIVPHGVLFRGGSEGTIRQACIEENLLDAVIGLPENLFYGTGLPAGMSSHSFECLCLLSPNNEPSPKCSIWQIKRSMCSPQSGMYSRSRKEG